MEYTQSSFRYFTKDSWEMWEDQIEKIFTPNPIKVSKEQGLVYSFPQGHTSLT